MSNNEITLIPYLHFQGTCEEALNNYKEILGGTVEIRERYDNPAMNAPDNYKDKVLHASFSFGQNTIMASDVFPGESADKGTGDASLSISVEDPGKGKKIFDALAEDGKISVPFDKQFWGAWHGNLTDRFGVRWMVNCE